MRKFILNSLAVVALLLGCTIANAQSAGSFFNDEPPMGFTTGASNIVTTWRICAASDSAFPCTSVNVFSDKILSTLVTQPVTLAPTSPASWSFYATPGVYLRQWSSNGTGVAAFYNEFVTAGSANSGTLGTYQGVTFVPIAGAAFLPLVAAASDIPIPAGVANIAGKKIRIHGSGVYTQAASTVESVEVVLCTISGCATGTVFAAAGCNTSTAGNANTTANAQFYIDCDLTVATTGASATLMAKSRLCINIGATTAIALTCLADTATAVSAAVDLTVREFVNVEFKYTTLNAANVATLDELSVEILN